MYCQSSLFPLASCCKASILESITNVRKNALPRPQGEVKEPFCLALFAWDKKSIFGWLMVIVRKSAVTRSAGARPGRLFAYLLSGALFLAAGSPCLATTSPSLQAGPSMEQAHPLLPSLGREWGSKAPIPTCVVKKEDSAGECILVVNQTFYLSPGYSWQDFDEKVPAACPDNARGEAWAKLLDCRRVPIIIRREVSDAKEKNRMTDHIVLCQPIPEMAEEFADMVTKSKAFISAYDSMFWDSSSCCAEGEVSTLRGEWGHQAKRGKNHDPAQANNVWPKHVMVVYYPDRRSDGAPLLIGSLGDNGNFSEAKKKELYAFRGSDEYFKEVNPYKGQEKKSWGCPR